MFVRTKAQIKVWRSSSLLAFYIQTPLKQRVETEQSVFEQGMNFYLKELFRLGELYIYE